MGCSGDEDDDDNPPKLLLLEGPYHHRSTSLTLDTAASATSATAGGAVLSPMHSKFAALSCEDVLRLIFENLPVSDLGRAACVCRLWRAVASDREVVAGAFKAAWGLKEVVGSPSSGGFGFWRDTSLGRFAISHHLVRGDSVASLALKYSVQVVDIKRLNNMMSDHGIYSRDRLLIPVSNPDLLVNATCYIELDVCAKREVAVLYLEGRSEKNLDPYPKGLTSDGGKRRLIDSLKRSMQADDGTALYYLSVSNGDPRAALSEFSEDLRWESRASLA